MGRRSLGTVIRKAFSLEILCAPLRRALPYAVIRKAFGLVLKAESPSETVGAGLVPARATTRVAPAAAQHGVDAVRYLGKRVRAESPVWCALAGRFRRNRLRTMRFKAFGLVLKT